MFNPKISYPCNADLSSIWAVPHRKERAILLSLIFPDPAPLPPVDNDPLLHLDKDQKVPLTLKFQPDLH